MAADKISDIYAKALLELAQAEGKIEEFEDELAQILNVFLADSNVWRFFKSPLLGLDEKKKILDKSFKKSISKTMYNFLGVLSDRRRFESFSQILESYSKFADEALGRTKVYVNSAVEVDESQLEIIKNEMERFLGKKVVFDHKIDPDLLGGIMVKSGDIMIDTTIKSSLDSIKNNLMSKKILGEEYYEN